MRARSKTAGSLLILASLPALAASTPTARAAPASLPNSTQSPPSLPPANAAASSTNATRPDSVGTAPSGTFLENYPGLQKYLYRERESKVYFGLGFNPLILVNNRLGLGLSIFQVHWLGDPWEVEWFNASIGTTFSQKSYAKDEYFLFRFAPMYRILKNISFGPLLGLEFVSFGNLGAQLNKDHLFTPKSNFSTFGFVYGVEASESFAYGKSNQIKVSEFVYKETYNQIGTRNGWTYAFDQPDLNADSSAIAPSTVFGLEISFLY